MDGEKRSHLKPANKVNFITDAGLEFTSFLWSEKPQIENYVQLAQIVVPLDTSKGKTQILSGETTSNPGLKQFPGIKDSAITNSQSGISTGNSHCELNSHNKQLIRPKNTAGV